MNNIHSIEELPRKEFFAQLFSILSNRRQNSEGQLIIGFSEEGLTKVLNRSSEETKELLKEFNDYILGLGLSVVEFIYHKERWYCIKSMYAAPIELNEEELSVLGTLVMITKGKDESIIEQSFLIEYLTSREYFNEYRLRRIIARLINSAYVEKNSGGKLKLGPRALIEMNEEVRRQIANQVNDLLF